MQPLLAPVEDGLPLLLERLRAFLRVLGHGDGDADLHLLLERLRGRTPEAGEDGALDGLDRERPVTMDDLRVSARFAHDLCRRHYSIDEPDAERFRGRELLARLQYHHRLVVRNLAWA